MKQDGAWTEWPAPAKLNLFLHVTGRRDDGYHDLQTVFQLLDWGDCIHLAARADGVLKRSGGVAGLPAEQDLAVRAARLLAATTGVEHGVEIRIEKRIPVAAGLGGGSSDAATVLVGLNEIWGTGLSTEALATLGATLGADVPVFVRGHSAWAEGRGEKLTPVTLGPAWYVLLDPGCAVSTAQLFQAPELTRNAAQETISRFVRGAVTDNAFEPLVRARYPRVAAALDWLGEQAFARLPGARLSGARLSGTGGAVFARVESRAEAELLSARCPQEFTAWAVAAVDQSPLLAAVEQYRVGA